MAKKPVKKPAKKSPVKKAQEQYSKKPEKKAFEQKLMHGALFKNEDKSSDSHPDMKGSYTDENGDKYWVAAWANVSKTGKKYLSFQMQSAEASNEEETEEEVDEDNFFS